MELHVESGFGCFGGEEGVGGVRFIRHVYNRCERRHTFQREVVQRSCNYASSKFGFWILRQELQLKAAPLKSPRLNASLQACLVRAGFNFLQR